MRILTRGPLQGMTTIGAWPGQQATLLIANLPAVAAELDSGAAVSIARGRLRVRPLPRPPRTRPARPPSHRPVNIDRASMSESY